METFIGIDVGGTNMTGAVATREGERLATERRKTNRDGGAPAGLAMILEIIAALRGEAVRRGTQVARIGIGFGGPVDSARGVVRLSHHVEGWTNFPLRDEIERATGLSAAIENDCNAATLGEWRFGAGRGVSDLLYINIGTGIGGGAIAGGRLLAGAVNGAGEIGHMTIDPNGPVCTCGRRGCLEALCAGPGIARRAAEARRNWSDELGATRLAEAATSEQVFAAAREGDPLGQRIVNDVARDLAHAIGNALVILNSELVILGGGVSEAGELLTAPLRAALPDFVLDFHAASARIVPAQFGYDAGVMGAVATAISAD